MFQSCPNFPQTCSAKLEPDVWGVNRGNYLATTTTTTTTATTNTNPTTTSTTNTTTTVIAKYTTKYVRRKKWCL